MNSIVPLDPSPRAVMNKSLIYESLFDELDNGKVNVDTYSVCAGYGMERYEKSVVLTSVN